MLRVNIEKPRNENDEDGYGTHKLAARELAARAKPAPASEPVRGIATGADLRADLETEPGPQAGPGVLRRAR